MTSQTTVRPAGEQLHGYYFLIPRLVMKICGQKTTTTMYYVRIDIL